VSEQTWTPTPWQCKVLERSEFEVLSGGSRGSGKTELGLAWLTEKDYFFHPKYHALILRKNAEDLNDWLLRAKRFWGGAVEITGKPAVLKFPGGGTGAIGHLKDANAYEKYLGHEYHKIIFEELTQVEEEDSYLKVISSCRVSTEYQDFLKPQVQASTNPGGRGHRWVKKRFVDCADGRSYRDPISGRSRIFVRGSVFDNPYIQEDYVGSLRALPDHLMRAWLLGDWEVFAGQMFYELSKDKHQIDGEAIKNKKHWPLYITGDWGFSRPYEIGFWRVDPDGRLYLFHEIYGSLFDQGVGKENVGLKESPSVVANKVKAFVSEELNETPAAFYAGPDWFDPSRGGGKSYSESFYEVGLNPVMVSTPPGSRIKGIVLLHERLSSQYPGIYIHKNCRAWWRTVPDLQLDPDNVEDIMGNQEDHCLDSALFICRMRNWVPVDKKPEIEKSAEEWAQINFRKVLAAFRKKVSGKSQGEFVQA
jgi:hypothetical protein